MQSNGNGNRNGNGGANGGLKCDVELEYTQINEDQVLIIARRPGKEPVESIVDVVPAENVVS